MWKQSTFFGFVAGALITLSLQALTAVGLFKVADQTPASNAPLTQPGTSQASNAAGSAAPTTGSAAPPTGSAAPPPASTAPSFDFADHLTFAPFILVAASLFFVAGALYFALSTTSSKFENAVAELTDGSMTASEKQEVERAVFLQFRTRLYSYFFFGSAIGFLGFLALMFRV